MTDDHIIIVSNADKVYGKRQVLSNVNLSIRKSEIFGLLGPSGAGKTTIVKLVAGIEKATAGEVTVMGVGMPKLDMMKKLGYMAQSDALYQELTAQENLEFLAGLYGLSGRRRKERIREMIELVGLQDYLNTPVHHFSGGMKRRLSLAGALLHHPYILILDEPTVGIDPVLRQSIWNKLEDLCRNGTTIILTTHVMDEAAKCHRLGMVREGKCIAAGTPETLMAYTKTSSIEEAFLVYGGESK
ncbi:ABC transporter ATP-binding protein [Bacillus marinisedimentorum]|uniref:ABC transporter ATP-binding protein n=1 Tax=Bacillus marinisedimentorum TaxID=1821260 RepID=UPI000873035A|nr:ABC transporter ATP-binding protein [Bacillus marinisedimentorum]